MELKDIPAEKLETGAWRKAWRWYRVELSDSEREKLGTACRSYRRRWGISQEDMAGELGCSPQQIGPIERAGRFASLRLLALIDRLDHEAAPTKLDPRSMRVVERKRLERERDRAHTTWINAGRPDAGPVKDALDATWRAIKARAGYLPTAPVEPAAPVSKKEGADDVEYPFT